MRGKESNYFHLQHLLLSYIQEQLQLLAAKKIDSPRIQALTNLCQVMLTSNEFLYLD